jgi:hypothetical protein
MFSNGEGAWAKVNLPNSTQLIPRRIQRLGVRSTRNSVHLFLARGIQRAGEEAESAL